MQLPLFADGNTLRDTLKSTRYPGLTVRFNSGKSTAVQRDLVTPDLDKGEKTWKQGNTK